MSDAVRITGLEAEVKVNIGKASSTLNKLSKAIGTVQAMAGDGLNASKIVQDADAIGKAAGAAVKAMNDFRNAMGVTKNNAASVLAGMKDRFAQAKDSAKGLFQTAQGKAAETMQKALDNQEGSLKDINDKWNEYNNEVNKTHGSRMDPISDYDPAQQEAYARATMKTREQLLAEQTQGLRSMKAADYFKQMEEQQARAPGLSEMTSQIDIAGTAWESLGAAVRRTYDILLVAANVARKTGSAMMAIGRTALQQVAGPLISMGEALSNFFSRVVNVAIT